MLALSPNDAEVMISLGDLYLREKHNSKALAMTNRAIVAYEATGAVAPEAWYRRVLSIAYDSRTPDAIQPAALALVAAYPNPVNWRDSLRALRVRYPESVEPAELDLWRLRAATGSLNTERDFVDFAETTLRLGFPSDAETALKQGIAKGILNTSKPLISEIIATASNQASVQKASLPRLEREATSNRQLALNIGDIYFGYGEFSRAASMYRMAIGEVGIDPSVANLRLGAALARAGDKAGARAAFTRVNGGFSEALARYWMVFVGR
ncbi:MAG: tetratricopeptide repeat protein [Hyphomonadaceae bacterium]